MRNTEKWYYVLMVIIVLIVTSILAYAPYREKEVFNKYKNESQPEATYVDALFSNLRINSK